MWINRYLLRNFLTRPRCVLTGCHAEHRCASSCDRCGEHIYEGWIDASVCDLIQRAWWRMRDTCGKRLPWRKRFSRWPVFCSSECEDSWIPF